MARNIAYWYELQVSEKELQTTIGPLLTADGADTFLGLVSALNSKSKVAIWRLLFWINAVVAWMLDTLFDIHKADVTALVNSRIYATKPWLVAKAKEFQYGDSLVEVNGQLGYAVIDESKQIIKFSALEQLDTGEAVLKIAAADGGGNPIRLSTPQYNSFSVYTNRIIPPGSRITIKSNEKDLLKLIAKIYYDGSEIETDLITAVELAINNYLNALPFDGVLEVYELIQAIKKVQGVQYVDVNTIAAKVWDEISELYGAYVAIDTFYKSDAGYIGIDPAFSLAANLTYEIAS